MAFEIWTIEDLLDLKNHLNDRCVLMTDIDASYYYTPGTFGPIKVDVNWEPVGTSENPFVGSLIGNGYTISNLKTDGSYGNNNGFFNYIGHYLTLINNGTFTGSAAGWSLGTGWAYGSNNVVKNADGTGLLSQTSGDMERPLVEEERYTLTYTISSHSVGSITPSIAGVELTTRTGNGTYTEEFTAITTDELSFLPSDTARFTIDNVTLRRHQVFTDVNLRNIDITGGGNTTSRTGGFAAVVSSRNNPSIEFHRCRVHGALRTNSFGGNIAGFVGEVSFLDGPMFFDCHTNITIRAELMGVNFGPGACGFAGTATYGTFEDCSSSGSIYYESDLSRGSIGGFSREVKLATRCKSSVVIVVNGTAYANNQFRNIGGFVSSGGQCTLCYATGNIFYIGNEIVRIGGFVGTASGAISKCFAVGSIVAETPSSRESVSSPLYKTCIGGFAGYGGSGISDCYSRGDVCKTGISGIYHRIGGFSGTHAIATRCYSSGFVAQGPAEAGGFQGYATAGATNSYFDKEESGYTVGVGGGTTTGVTGLTTEEMKIESSYHASWDFDTIWIIREFLRSAVGATSVTVWLSKTSDYDNFAEGVKENDSFSLVVPSTNEIRWLGALEALLLGTAGDEWRISSNRLDTALSPTNFKVAQQSEHGSSRIQPVKMNSSLLFVDFVARKLREMTYVDPKYVANDMTALAEHITLHGITTIARQKNPDSILWLTLGNGDLISVTFERDQDVVAWAKQPLARDGFAQSVAVIPGETEDIIYLTVKRTIDSVEKVYIEKMAPRVFETKEDAFFVDCGITTSITKSDTITGLDHLEGAKVAVVADGVVIYDGTEDESVVTGGEVTLPEAITAAKVHVGLPYTAILKPMRIAIGDSMGSMTRINEIVVSFLNSMGVKYGNDLENLYAIDFNDPRWTNTASIDGLFSGEVVVSMPGKIDPLNPVFIVSDQPTPCVPRCIVARIDKTGR